jgi:hypothetical protein
MIGEHLPPSGVIALNQRCCVTELTSAIESGLYNFFADSAISAQIIFGNAENLLSLDDFILQRRIMCFDKSVGYTDNSDYG